MDLSNKNVIHVKNGDVEYLQFRKLLEYRDLITHAYGLKKLDYRTHLENDALNSYEKLFDKLNINIKTLVKPIQEHTNNILNIYEKQNKNGPDIMLDYLKGFDGTITDKTGITLATTNADCILIIFFDPIKKVICNIHSGWRGTFKKISKNAIEKMKSEYGCNPENIIACICPSIRVCHFEVDEDVMQMCKEIFAYTNRLDEIIRVGEVKDGKQKYNIDTVLITKILLEDEGILAKNIIDSEICSVCCSEKVYSRRADGGNFGLGTAIIGLND